MEPIFRLWISLLKKIPCVDNAFGSEEIHMGVQDAMRGMNSEDERDLQVIASIMICN